MTDSIFQDADHEHRGPRGKAIGFLDSIINGGSLREALTNSAVEDHRVEIFFGTEGEQNWEKMMGSATWGEQAELLYKKGLAVLAEGEAIFAVQVADRPEAMRIAELARAHGGRSVTYFGELVDTQLTA